MLINVHKAKSGLSALILLAEEGQEVIIARNGKPAVKLVRLEMPKRFPGGKRPLGTLAAKHPLPVDFDQRWQEHKAEMAQMFDEPDVALDDLLNASDDN
jgi:prevent-host-death family protein